MKSLLLIIIHTSFLYAYFNPLHRPYTQKNNDVYPLELELHKGIYGKSKHTFIFPSNCKLDNDCTISTISYSLSDSYISFSPLLGLEYRYNENYKDRTKVIELGSIITAKKYNLDLYLDVRAFGESNSSNIIPSYDREFVDKQSEEVNNQATFTSYSRYRGNLNIYFKLGTFSAAREAIHWGPGIYNNFVFNQKSIPFNQISYQTTIGPLKVISLYAPLVIDSRAGSPLNKFSRDLYAHRYELSLTPNLLIGISEQIVLYENNQSFMFFPFVPLFIEKSLVDENSNNGNLSLDLSYKQPGLFRIYSEFFIDDMESPGTLLTEDFIQNKWGYLGGAHVIYDYNDFSNGFIFEYARLEPYAYTHFEANTAQIANQGYPLGNQLGPNSQVLNFKIYSRYKMKHYLSLKFDVIWKGIDYGSDINDLTTHFHTEQDGKSFLKGAEPDIYIEPYFSTQWKFFKFETTIRFGKNSTFSSRIYAMY